MLENRFHDYWIEVEPPVGASAFQSVAFAAIPFAILPVAANHHAQMESLYQLAYRHAQVQVAQASSHRFDFSMN